MPHSAANCFLVFLIFKRISMIRCPDVAGLSGDKKATNGDSLPLGLPRAESVKGIKASIDHLSWQISNKQAVMTCEFEQRFAKVLSGVYPR